jgi:hypothetical protein
MRFQHRTLARKDRRGTALVAVVVGTVGVAMLSLALITLSSSAASAQRRSREERGALYVAEAGIADALCTFECGGSGNLGREDQRVDFGGSSYWVETTNNGDGTFSIVSTGIEGHGGSRVELVVEPSKESFHRWAAFGNEGLTMNTAVKVDSYDSTEGSYSDQCDDTPGGSGLAASNGSTGSNADITLAGSVQVAGDCRPGVDGTLTILDTATVGGSTTPLDAPVEMTDIDVPDIATSGPLDIPDGESASIGPGDLHYDHLSAGTGATLLVTGPATIVFDSFELMAQSGITVDAEDGPVEFIVKDDFEVLGDTKITSTTSRPADVSIKLLSDNVADGYDDDDMDLLEFGAGAQIYGTLYAPKAHVAVHSSFELFGSLVARQVELDNTAALHFDEDLLKSTETGHGSYSTICWRELSYHPSKSVLAQE